MVACLRELEPVRFEYFIHFRDAGDSEAVALEKAYGRKVDELQAYWVFWLKRQK
jgi:hypothetical protein